MADNYPLVSIICLCFNHEKFIDEALQSVLAQDYPNIEVIIVDDASTDNSVQVINSLLQKHPAIQFIGNQQNEGNCRSFNKGLAKSKGKYIIDLALDDVLISDRVSLGVSELEKLGNQYGVHYGNVTLISEDGTVTGSIAPAANQQTEGNLYSLLIEKFILSAPSMLMRRSVLEKLDGYDEALTYEDFDFWIRSSRDHFYAFTDRIVVKKRIHQHNYSRRQRKFLNKQMYSTYLLCEKIYHLNRSIEEFNALKYRLKYEMRKSLQYGGLKTFFKYYTLYRKTHKKLKNSHD